jgi:hypothetical protein
MTENLHIGWHCEKMSIALKGKEPQAKLFASQALCAAVLAEAKSIDWISSGNGGRMRSLRAAFQDLRQFLRAFVGMNLVYFGVLLSAMLFVVFHRQTQQALLSSVTSAFQTTPIGEAYAGGHLASAILMTFAVNLIAGSLLYITLPSLVVPFAGICLGLVRAAVWGVMFSPQSAPGNASGWVLGALTGLLVLLEGEGYVLAMLGSYVQGWTLLHPREAGADTRGNAYLLGARRSLRMYWLVAAQLAVAAIYEVLLVIVIRPHLV